MEDEDDVCGAVVSVRKSHDRVAVWTGTASEKGLQKKIGTSFKSTLEVGRNTMLKYQSHADAAANGCSFQNQV